MGFFQLPHCRDVILSSRNAESAAVQFSRPAAMNAQIFHTKIVIFGPRNIVSSAQSVTNALWKALFQR
jgi:hypothetical protein